MDLFKGFIILLRKFDKCWSKYVFKKSHSAWNCLWQQLHQKINECLRMSFTQEIPVRISVNPKFYNYFFFPFFMFFGYFWPPKWNYRGQNALFIIKIDVLLYICQKNGMLLQRAILPHCVYMALRCIVTWQNKNKT